MVNNFLIPSKQVRDQRFGRAAIEQAAWQLVKMHDLSKRENKGIMETYWVRHIVYTCKNTLFVLYGGWPISWVSASTLFHSSCLTFCV